MERVNLLEALYHPRRACEADLLHGPRGLAPLYFVRPEEHAQHLAKQRCSHGGHASWE